MCLEGYEPTTTTLDLEKLTRDPEYYANIPGATSPDWYTRPGVNYGWSGSEWMPSADIPGEWARYSDQPWSPELATAGSWQQPQSLIDLEQITRTPGFYANIPGAYSPDWSTKPGPGYSWGGTGWVPTVSIPEEWGKFSDRPWSPELATAGYMQPWEQIPETPTGEEQEFPYPTQWGIASDALTELAQTGMPGITPEYAAQAWLPYQRQGQQESMQAREQAGLEGLRWSTPLAGQFEDIWGGASERFGAQMEGARLGDIQGQRQARLSATGQLAGLGEQYAQLPLSVSQQMMGMGALQQGMQQQEISPLLQEFMRTQPEYSPLLQYMFGGATGLPFGPQMYGQSTGGNIMSWLPMLLMLL